MAVIYPFQMNTLFTTLIVVGTGLVAYAMAYFAVAMQVEAASRQRISPFNLWRVFLEGLGALARHMLKVNTLSWSMDAFALFNLDRNSATHRDLECAALPLYQALAQRPVVFPPSQVRALDLLMAEAAEAIKQREAVAQLVREMHRQRREEEDYRRSAHRQQGAAADEQGWRAVMGLPPDERRIDVVKQAYRRLARAAHPDRGGSDAAMVALNAAMEQARKELGFI